jgi:C-terminal processing protease CtpA/Prc
VFVQTALTAVFGILLAVNVQTVAPLTQAQRHSVVNTALAKLTENYVFPEAAQRIDTAIRKRLARGDYDAAVDGPALASKLTADLREISHDKHLEVFFSEEALPNRELQAERTPEEKERARQQMAKTNFGFEKIERMQGNIGYLDLRAFMTPSWAGPTAAAAIAFLSNTDALIIDLRQNDGGDPAMVAFLAAYLFDEPVRLSDVVSRRGTEIRQWWTPPVTGAKYARNKPVFILTSGSTFSAGEQFPYDLKTLGRATIVGETTGGGAHPFRPYRIDDHFSIGVPFGRAVNPITSSNWEGTGVTPDIPVVASDALAAAWKKAVETVLAATTNPQRKEQLEQLLSNGK